MCGIVGYVGDRSCRDLLLHGLERLEYRGYDSAGLSLLGDGRIDEGRVITEVAIWADKSDVTEELARLRAHLDQFSAMLDKGGAVGRPLDFLIQELGREVNTAASKGDDLELSQAAIAAKGVLEKMREQVQNLE
jgi:uncharacterized protein (TIGR00255 family)